MLFAAFSRRDRAGTATEVSALIRGAGEFVLPVIEGRRQRDRVNGQLDKVDKITDSAVEAAA